MDLRSLKKEVHSLENVDEMMKKFQDNWLRPVRSNTNSHIPFINKVSPEVKKELNRRLAHFQDTLYKVKKGQIINEKLTHYTRYLIELKLTEMQDDPVKSKIITNNMLNDEFFNLQNTISEVKAFDLSTKKLSICYNEINGLLQKELSLDETLFFMDLPHRKYLYNLLHIAKKQKSIVRHIGKEFVSMVRKTNGGK